MRLAQILRQQPDEILRRWEDRVRGAFAPASMPTLELTNGLPLFLDELSVNLERRAGKGPVPSAAQHGEQRLRLGFSLDAVVREYGALRHAILETARASDVEVSWDELDTLADGLVNGIALAVAEYTMRRDAEQARQANEHFAFIAHEIRNPLSNAITAFELAKERDGSLADEPLMQMLQRSLASLHNLIDHSLQAARVASGIELRKEATTLSALVEESESDVAAEALRKHVSLRSEVHDDAPVLLDVRLIRSALVNLLRNAVKFTTEGGDVEVRARVENERAILEVEDCCGGLEPGFAERAFAPFVRLHSKENDGFGLGLAIAKQAVDAHGGSARVQDLPGKGCNFVLEIPVETSAA